jgi:hypothetical protein
VATVRRGGIVVVGELGGEEFRPGRGEERSSVRCGMLRGSSGCLL